MLPQVGLHLFRIGSATFHPHMLYPRKLVVDVQVVRLVIAAVKAPAGPGDGALRDTRRNIVRLGDRLDIRAPRAVHIFGGANVCDFTVRPTLGTSAHASAVDGLGLDKVRCSKDAAQNVTQCDAVCACGC